MSTDEVTRETVEHVLKAHKVDLSNLEIESVSLSSRVRDSIADAGNLKELVGKRKLQYLARKFGIPIHYFYHPLEVPPLPGENIH